MNNKNTLFLLLTFLALAGCGGGGGGGGDQSPAPPDTQPDPARLEAPLVWDAGAWDEAQWQ